MAGWSAFTPARPSAAGTWTADKKFNQTEFEIIRQNFEGLGSRRAIYPLVLGGARADRHNNGNTNAFDHPNYWDAIIDWTDIQTGWTVIARVEVITANAAGSVTPRIRNTTDPADISGSASTSTSWAEQTITIPVPGTIGIKRYRFQLIQGSASHAVNGLGVIEIYA